MYCMTWLCLMKKKKRLSSRQDESSFKWHTQGQIAPLLEIVTLSLLSDAGRWKFFGVPVVNGRQNLLLLVGIGLTDLQKILGGHCPPTPSPPHRPFQFRHHKYFKLFNELSDEVNERKDAFIWSRNLSHFLFYSKA